jgi:hypothetical protein
MHFSDMERAWALLHMKQALGDAPWELVEDRFRLSRSRRQDLLRLLAFTEAQQYEVARLRLRETHLRPLHTALRSGELTHAYADTVLTMIAGLSTAPNAPAPGVDSAAIARLVTQAKRNVEGVRSASSTPQWLTALSEQLDRTEKSLLRAAKRVGELREADAAALVTRLVALSLRMTELADSLSLPQAKGEMSAPDESEGSATGSTDS